MNCEDFKSSGGVCMYFISNGACKVQTRFMCILWLESGKPPVQEDVPLFEKEVLEAFPGSRIVDVKMDLSTEAKEFLATYDEKKQEVVIKPITLKDFFGEI